MNIHIIDHTHWDREWFLTSEYTTPWIPKVIDALVKITEENPDYRFAFDGQTLFLEDLMSLAPEYKQKVHRLIAAGQLIPGPYYCQPDWRIPCGESLLRNLQYGIEDTMQWGAARPTAGWLVDIFGHLSQTPQLHRMHGIHEVFLWRGIPSLQPYFDWQGADGRKIIGINLIGGYRNLYGVAEVPEVALARLLAEIDKLAPQYPTPDIPLFDGYDLDWTPEDPIAVYEDRKHLLERRGITLHQSSPSEFASRVAALNLPLAMHKGEQISGKYAAVFPGTLSSRDYLKVMNFDCEHLLYDLHERLGAIMTLLGQPVNESDARNRALLKNQVHDCICGVSIDLVHEKMEFNYRKLFDELCLDIETRTRSILGNFKSGLYAIATSPFDHDVWMRGAAVMHHVQTKGVGVFPVLQTFKCEQVSRQLKEFVWRNEWFSASVVEDGTVHMDNRICGRFGLSVDQGDTYSDLIGVDEIPLVCNALRLIETSPVHAIVEASLAGSLASASVSATVRILFDQSPLVRWDVDVKSRGAEFCAMVHFDSAQDGQVMAGMPFDTVPRPAEDRDNLPMTVDASLARILLGQRELDITKTFPFQNHVGIASDDSVNAVLARGIYAYRATASGRVSLLLRRSVEWLTRTNLAGRSGDAGPVMYVPDARCERTVTHNFACIRTNMAELPRWSDLYKNEPLIASSICCGSREEQSFLREPLPLSALIPAGNHVRARFFNPHLQDVQLSRPHSVLDSRGAHSRIADQARPKEILTCAIDAQPVIAERGAVAEITLLNAPQWRCGANEGQVDLRVVEEMKRKKAALEIELSGLRASGAPGAQKHKQKHAELIIEREILELEISIVLNQQKAERSGQPLTEATFDQDPTVREIGIRLNELRRVRRIFDYVVGVPVSDAENHSDPEPTSAYEVTAPC